MNPTNDRNLTIFNATESDFPVGAELPSGLAASSGLHDGHPSNSLFTTITASETFNSRFFGQCGQHRIRMDTEGISI